MIPIYDDNPTRRLTWVALSLIALNVAVFGYMLSLAPDALSEFIARRAFVPADFFAAPSDPHQLLTLLTAMFIHAGWLHLGGNMLYLWIFGNNVEDRLGTFRFILFYLLAGVVATFAHAAIAPESTVPLVGASGAIAGVLGAYAVLFPRARVITIVPILFIIELASIPAAFVIGFWFVLQLAQGLGSLGAATGGVAWWAHVAGLLFGLIVGAAVALGRRPSPRKRSGRAAKSSRAKR